MKYKVVILESAVQQIKEIKNYLEPLSGQAAVRIPQQIMKQISALEDRAMMYQVYEKNPAYRRLFVENYTVFYRILDEEETVKVYQVLHSMMDASRRI